MVVKTSKIDLGSWGSMPHVVKASEILADAELYAQNVPADGDCFLSAACDSLGLPRDQSRLLRRAVAAGVAAKCQEDPLGYGISVVEALKGPSDTVTNINPNINEYRERMSRPGTYMAEAEVAETSSLLRCPIEVIKAEEGKEMWGFRVDPESEETHFPVVRLLHVNNNHYMALLRSGPDGALCPQVELPWADLLPRLATAGQNSSSENGIQPKESRLCFKNRVPAPLLVSKRMFVWHQASLHRPCGHPVARGPGRPRSSRFSGFCYRKISEVPFRKCSAEFSGPARKSRQQRRAETRAAAHAAATLRRRMQRQRNHQDWLDIYWGLNMRKKEGQPVGGAQQSDPAKESRRKELLSLLRKALLRNLSAGRDSPQWICKGLSSASSVGDASFKARVLSKAEITTALFIGGLELNPGHRAEWNKLFEDKIVAPGKCNVRCYAYGKWFYFDILDNWNLVWVQEDNNRVQPSEEFFSVSGAAMHVMRTVKDYRMSVDGWLSLQYKLNIQPDCVYRDKLESLVKEKGKEDGPWVRVDVLRSISRGDDVLKARQNAARNGNPRVSWDNLLPKELAKTSDFLVVPTEGQIAKYRQLSAGRAPLEGLSKEGLVADLKLLLVKIMGRNETETNRRLNAKLNEKNCKNMGKDPSFDYLTFYKEVLNNGGMQLDDVSVDDLWIGNINWAGNIFPKMTNYTQGHRSTSIGSMLWKKYAQVLLPYQVANQHRDKLGERQQAERQGPSSVSSELPATEVLGSQAEGLETSSSIHADGNAVSSYPLGKKRGLEALGVEMTNQSLTSGSEADGQAEYIGDVQRRVLAETLCQVELSREDQAVWGKYQQFLDSLAPQDHARLQHVVLPLFFRETMMQAQFPNQRQTGLFEANFMEEEALIPNPEAIMKTFQLFNELPGPATVEIPVGPGHQKITCGSKWCRLANKTHEKQPLFRRVLHDLVCKAGDSICLNQESGAWMDNKVTYLHGSIQKMKTAQVCVFCWVDSFLFGRTCIIFLQNEGGNLHCAQLSMSAVNSFNDRLAGIRDEAAAELRIAVVQEDYFLECGGRFGKQEIFEQNIVGLATSPRRINILADNTNKSKLMVLTNFLEKNSRKNGQYISVYVDEWDKSRVTPVVGLLMHDSSRAIRNHVSRFTLISANNAGAVFSERELGCHVQAPDTPGFRYIEWNSTYIEPMVKNDPEEALGEYSLPGKTQKTKSLAKCNIKLSNAAEMFDKYLVPMLDDMFKDETFRHGLIFPSPGTNREVQETLMVRFIDLNSDGCANVLRQIFPMFPQGHTIDHADQNDAMLMVGLVNQGHLSAGEDARGWRVCKVSEAMVPYMHLLLSRHVLTDNIAQYLWRLVHKTKAFPKLVASSRGDPVNLVRQMFGFHEDIVDDAKREKSLESGACCIRLNHADPSIFYYRKDLEIKIIITMIENLNNNILKAKRKKLDLVWIGGGIIGRGLTTKTIEHTLRLTDLFYACNYFSLCLNRAEIMQQSGRFLGTVRVGMDDSRPRRFWGSWTMFCFIEACHRTEISMTNELMVNGQNRACATVLNNKLFPVEGNGRLGTKQQEKAYSLDDVHRENHKVALTYDFVDGLQCQPISSTSRQYHGGDDMHFVRSLRVGNVIASTGFLTIGLSDPLFQIDAVKDFFASLGPNRTQMAAKYHRATYSGLYDAIAEWAKRSTSIAIKDAFTVKERQKNAQRRVTRLSIRNFKQGEAMPWDAQNLNFLFVPGAGAVVIYLNPDQTKPGDIQMHHEFLGDTRLGKMVVKYSSPITLAATKGYKRARVLHLSLTSSDDEDAGPAVSTLAPAPDSPRRAPGFGFSASIAANTCHLKATLQCLCRIGLVTTYFENADGLVAAELAEICTALEGEESAWRNEETLHIDIDPLIGILSCYEDFDEYFGHEQCAVDTMQRLLNVLYGQELGPDLDDSGPPLQIKLLWTRGRPELFWCLSVPLVFEDKDRQNLSLEELLQSRVMRDRKKGCGELECMPPVLSVQIQRFGFALGAHKIDPPVYVPERVSLDRYSADPSQRGDYELHSFVMHHGSSIHSGHYTAICKSQDSRWLSFNEGDVRVVDAADAMEEAKHASLLFFTKIEPESPMAVE